MKIALLAGVATALLSTAVARPSDSLMQGRFTLSSAAFAAGGRAGASRDAFLAALKGRVLATATLIGRYSRS